MPGLAARPLPFSLPVGPLELFSASLSESNPDRQPRAEHEQSQQPDVRKEGAQPPGTNRTRRRSRAPDQDQSNSRAPHEGKLVVTPEVSRCTSLLHFYHRHCEPRCFAAEDGLRTKDRNSYRSRRLGLEADS